MYYKALVDFLYRNDYLILPGIGQLRIVANNRDSSTGIEKMHAPYRSLVFSEVIDKSLSKQIAEIKTSWTRADIQCLYVLESFSNEIISRCKNDQSFILPGLGEINYSDGLYEFNSLGEVEKKCNYFNHDVSLRKAYNPSATSREMAVSAFENSEKSTISDSKKETGNTEYIVLRPKYYKVAAAILLFIVSALAGITLLDTTTSLNLPVKYNLDKTEIEADRINKSPDSDGTEANIDQLASEKEYNDSLIQRDTNSQSKALLVDEPNSDYLESKQSRIQENEKNQSIEGSLSNEKQDFSLNEDNKSKESVDEELCIYIMGSFTNSKNVSAMKLKLDKLGYRVYKAPYNGATRIGVIIPCNNTKSLHQIEQIEDSYWLLN